MRKLFYNKKAVTLRPLSFFKVKNCMKLRKILSLFLDNPVLCDAGLADLTVALEVNHAKVYGVANDCPTTTTAMPESTTPLPPLPPTLLLAAATAASGGNVSFAATLE